MFHWINDLSLRKKLYLVFGIMVTCAVGGIIIGQMTLARVQVGGTVYSEIMGQMQAAHDMSKLLLSINLARGRTAALMSETDRQKQTEHVEAIKAQTAAIDGLFTSLEAATGQSDLPAAKTSISRAKEAWNALRETRDNTIIPLVLRNEREKAQELAGGTQAERFATMAGAVADADAALNRNIGKLADKVKKESEILRIAYACGGSIFVLFLVIIARFFSSNIISPIVMVSRQSRAMAEGDFHFEKSAGSRRDEIGMMMNDFALMSEKISAVVGRIKSGIMNLSSASEELSTTADSLSRGTQEQSQQGSDVVRAVSEMSHTIMDVAKNASQAAAATQDSSGMATGGKEIVGTTVSSMLTLADDVKKATDTIRDLDRSAVQIGEIVAVISDIADQTNLLALNAAIEAARAGEQGRGFAIVADEVRKLAERTAKATGDIKQKIASIQEEAGKSVAVMQKGSAEVEKGVTIAREASQSMDTIVRSSSDVVDMVQRIAVATEEQSATAEQITHNMGSMTTLINQSAEATEHINQAARNLAHLSLEIQGHMEWFRSNGHGPA